MDKTEKLTFMDYITWPVSDLLKHPDFSHHAMRVCYELTQMTTNQLEQLDVISVSGGK